MIAEPLATEVGFRQAMPLDHRPHRAVEEQDPFREEVVQALDRGHAYRFAWDLGFGIWVLASCSDFSPLAISTANGSPALLRADVHAARPQAGRRGAAPRARREENPR